MFIVSAVYERFVIICALGLVVNLELTEIFGDEAVFVDVLRGFSLFGLTVDYIFALVGDIVIITFISVIYRETVLSKVKRLEVLGVITYVVAAELYRHARFLIESIQTSVGRRRIYEIQQIFGDYGVSSAFLYAFGSVLDGIARRVEFDYRPVFIVDIEFYVFGM